MQDQADPLLGQLVAGRYRIVSPLGEGGMGHVYLALHEAIEKQMALKVLKPEYSAKEDIVTRFQQEAISASRIKHPNVLEVFDFGKLDNGCAFLAMEFLSGNDLADELMHHGYIKTKRALRITLQICRALASAHRAGVVHRDMKPDNVFLQRTGDGEEIVKIVDFGIAQLRLTNEEEAQSAPRRRRLTKTGMIFGTPEYMAPEQAAGKKADQRVDVYAVGIMLFEMLTGAVPFTGDSFMGVLAAHLNDPVPSMLQYRPDLDVSDALHHVVTRALAKVADERFTSMTDLAAALLATPEAQRLRAAGELNPTTLPPPPPTLGTSSSNLTRPHGSSDPARYGSDPGTLGHGEVRAGALGDADLAASRSSNPSPAPKLVTAAVGTPEQLLSGDGSKRQGTLQAATTTRSVDDKGGADGRRHAGQRSVIGPVLGVAATVIAVATVGWFVIVPSLGGAGEGAAITAGAQVNVSPSPDPAPVEPGPSAAEMVTAAAEVTPPHDTSAVEQPKVDLAPADPKVKISVVTDPPGAVLEKDGFQVCDRTPCEVELDEGEAVEFSAVLGGRRGQAKVLAQKDQTVSIALRGAPAPRPSPPPAKKMCEVNVGGLKILRECGK